MVLCEFHIMHPKPTHVPLSLNPLFISATSHLSEEKKLIVEAVVYHILSFNILFCPHVFVNIHCNNSLVWYE